ncbi:hypothetical protein HPB50_021276 [Hyalomma asiaticum]|uniref:Uncharacterized protein n=1 Tax=Hyalomma asiaticum TaxID=266040 RepID=A0ACB7S5G5_HYAAI|nr:hypothetical protein HPB50_021276 [Hyalomma asiaticum]
MAQRLLGDIQLLVGDQQLPFRGHVMASGEICQGVITINPDETPPRIKSELKWSQGTILGVRTLGNSTAAVVTCSGGPALHLLLQCRGVHTPLQKDHPACTLCGTIGHRASARRDPLPVAVPAVALKSK